MFEIKTKPTQISNFPGANLSGNLAAYKNPPMPVAKAPVKIHAIPMSKISFGPAMIKR